MSLGTQDVEAGLFPHCPVFIPQGLLVLHSWIIWRQLHIFWEEVHHRAAEGTKSWGLPFSFLITFILRKKGIKGTAVDGHISDHPHFGRIQWNQSYSHMPRGHRARAPDEPEMMNIEELAAQPKPSVQPEATVELDAADDEEEGEE